jgi:hypothetical protein
MCQKGGQHCQVYSNHAPRLELFSTCKKVSNWKRVEKTNNNSVELLNAWAWAWAWANSLLTVVFDLINFTLQKFKSFSAIIGA